MFYLLPPTSTNLHLPQVENYDRKSGLKGLGAYDKDIFIFLALLNRSVIIGLIYIHLELDC